MKKLGKKLIVAFVVGILCYNACYIEPLDAYTSKKTKSDLGVPSLVEDFVSNKIEHIAAINIIEFLSKTSSNLVAYSQEHGKKLGISSKYNFIVQGQGKVMAIETENIVLKVNNATNQTIKIAADFIFGNAIRDGSGIASVGDYQNTMDFNNISVLLNNYVREHVVPPFQSKVALGDLIEFKGAIQIDTENPNEQELRVIPLLLKIKS